MALLLGSVDIPLRQVLATLAGGGDALTHSILFELRLPRSLAAFACGALLALAGSLLQALLRNPLADPYVLGVSGAAAVGALLGMLLGLSGALGGALSLLFALGGMALLALFAASASGWNPYRVLLTGMALSSALALEDPAPQYRIILAARDDVAKSDLVAKLVTGYKSNEYRRFVETDPKAKGFSRPEYWR